MSEKHTVEIPEFYLLTIAAYGNMGDGDLPKIMQIWAQRECKRLGIESKMIDLQKEHLRELEKRIRNVVGNDAVDKLASDIGKVATALKGVL